MINVVHEVQSVKKISSLQTGVSPICMMNFGRRAVSLEVNRPIWGVPQR